MYTIELPEKRIDELVEQWHINTYEGEIYQFLGATKEDYGNWVSYGGYLTCNPEILAYNLGIR